jgi:ATP-dependent helicase/nuclease subunit B
VSASWLPLGAADEPSLLIAATTEAASAWLRREALSAAAGATFGRHRTTMWRLAAELAEEKLAEAGRVPAGRLAAEAAAARAAHRLAATGGLGRLAAVADAPGFVRAISDTLEELRLARLAPPAELAPLALAYAEELAAAGLADAAEVLARATEAARGDSHRLLGLPTYLIDVPVHSVAARELIAALAERAPVLRASAPEGDAETLRHLEAAGVLPETHLGRADADTSLARLQTHLFAETAPAKADLDESVRILSAPGESRECVEIARRLLREAEGGVPFDRMAVLLRSPEEYRPHLEEALARAGIGAWFARGAVQPDPAGRAFLALLTCAAEGLSARAFAEYASLGQVPREPGAAPPPEGAWVPPDEEMVPELVADALAPDPEADEPADGSDSFVAPRRWEQLLVDAAVIGGRERWERRLSGLAAQLHAALEEQERDEPDGPAAERTRRTLLELASLRVHALPILDALAALPEDPRWSWGEWLGALRALAVRALRRPARVLATLAELDPMAAAGPVGLREVRLVLERRLLELRLRPPKEHAGRVCIAPIDAARGLDFDVVCVPGLAERLFPRKIAEDPILLDAARSRLGAELATNETRLGRERLQLRIAVGAARKRLLLSYPRLDLDQSRPRVPSFYALEALRAATGELPDFRELARRAEQVTETRVGWPAPKDPKDAIDAAEHDLALLERLLGLDEARAEGTAAYLLRVNPHLARALRFRARRWFAGWTVADGLVAQRGVALAQAALEALAAHQLPRRSFSATALQNFAACPYRFFLNTVHKLAPREVPQAIDELDPLQRGSLVHDVQFELFSRLAREGGEGAAIDLEAARERLDDVLDEVAARHREELAPAIDRVWEDGIAAIRADLREWLRRASLEWRESGYAPWRFELAFGLPLRVGHEVRERDAHSVDEPVQLESGLRLRGSIDLVERRSAGRGQEIRVTDQKTGRDRVPKGALVAGGESLQPVLYALAAEQLFPGAHIDEGRLSYCTAAGGFSVRGVAVSEDARNAAEVLARTVEGALDPARPFLPALPKERGCTWCDFRVVCGPYEELRTQRKWAGHEGVESLAALRSLP